MNRIKPPPPVTLDRGIDAVVHAAVSAEMAGMPSLFDLVDVAPTDAVPSSRLDQLLAASNIGGFIDDALRPPLHGSDLLSPKIFGAVLDQTLARLPEAAGDDARLAKILGRAAGVLDQKKNLLELLFFYRAALVQG